ncbi:hypothetical protein V1477_007787 [Vespula maculifrons]|uniref:Uncharacterized protein n=1 Tax=Vespula maculifrons TaxID=7453 RepID=A0ABD2CFW5_VESMC
MWGCILAHWADEQIRHDVPVDYVQAHVGPPNFGVLCTEEWKEKIRVEETRPLSYLQYQKEITHRGYHNNLQSLEEKRKSFSLLGQFVIRFASTGHALDTWILTGYKRLYRLGCKRMYVDNKKKRREKEPARKMNVDACNSIV